MCVCVHVHVCICMCLCVCVHVCACRKVNVNHRNMHGRIGLEVREQRYEEAEALYRESTTSAEDTETRNFYAWRYARFAAKVREIA